MKIIPNFSYPASTWAATILTIFKAGDVKHEEDNVSKIYAPQIIAKLPSDIASTLPIDLSVKSLLKYLSNYDAPRLDMRSVIQNSQSDEKPSTRFAQTVKQTRKTLNADITDEAVNEIAWSLVLSTFSAQMKTVALVLNVNKFPNADQLIKLDHAYLDHKAEATTIAATQANQNYQQAPNNYMYQRTTTPEHYGQRMTNNFNARPTQPYTNNFLPQQRFQRQFFSPQQNSPQRPFSPPQAFNRCNCFYHQRFGAFAKQCEFQRNFAQSTVPMTNNSNNSDICFYHRKFGKDARQCEKPCKFGLN